ncbi:SemiSWEET family sugar transporter [Pelosinus sp. sgz500959]|uniref:SemiSWEET family sugar transporter n=1 Tax=Pelosinus sp. sgz500959 TaxID=3242472 RepID=UPI00366E3BFC
MIGMIAGILTTCAFFPQVIKTVKSKSTDDLSWTWLVMMIGGVFLWLVYGYYINSISLLVANIVTFVSVNILFGVKYNNHCKKKHS